MLAVLYVALVISGCLMQRKLLYHPSRITLEAGVPEAAAQGFEPWRNSVGDYIGWKHTAKTAARGQILIIHGNAGSAIDRLDYMDTLQTIRPVDVFVLEYPGYGARKGSPSQKHFFAAADEAIALMTNGSPVYIVGESIGTGVAAYLAGAHPTQVRGLLLFAPYYNLTEVAQYHVPWLPARLLLPDKFPSAKYLENYHGPVAVVLAGQDQIVPNKFGRKLYDSYAGPKKVWMDPDAGHNDLIERPTAWWSELLEFWDQNGPQK